MRRLWVWWKYKGSDNFWLKVARRAPKPLRRWIIVDAFAKTWAKPPYKTPDEIGYSDVMKDFS